MEYIIKVLLRAHIFLLLIVLISYIIEKITGLILIVTAFLEEKKDYNEARGNTGLFTILYFLYLLIFLLYDVYIANHASESYAFWKWLIVVIPLTSLFVILFHKFQGREPGYKNKKH